MQGSSFVMFRWLVWREVTLAWRRRSDLLSMLVFFAIVVSLFPLGIGPETRLLRAIAPGIVWVAALLATTLSLNRLFAEDYADGTLEQLLLTPQPVFLIVIGKLLAQWLVSAIPLVLMAPLLGLQFGLPGDALRVLAASLALGFPVLSLIGAIGAALTLGLRGGGVLVSLLVLPLYVPALVFGAGAVESSLVSVDPSANLYLLASLLALSLTFAPWAAAAALRISME